ncbi:hypothetical protein [Sphingomonas sp. MMS24-J13]|uniref:hypothetical protein n=1 Tax=Sphingomonas sp. MMS24-J13 TaxID=3238686 RepID=UPI00384B99F3
MTENKLRVIDDDSLLEMYETARIEEDGEQCDLITAELHWRGIEVTPCGWQPK